MEENTMDQMIYGNGSQRQQNSEMKEIRKKDLEQKTR
jgi:hypothetical protein